MLPCAGLPRTHSVEVVGRVVVEAMEKAKAVERVETVEGVEETVEGVEERVNAVVVVGIGNSSTPIRRHKNSPRPDNSCRTV